MPWMPRGAQSRLRRAAVSRLGGLRGGRPPGRNAMSRESAEPSGAAAQGYDPSAVPVAGAEASGAPAHGGGDEVRSQPPHSRHELQRTGLEQASRCDVECLQVPCHL